jgi:GNAT superfamily N-acetyltransferase
MPSSISNLHYHVRYATPADLDFAANLERENMSEYFQRFKIEYPADAYSVSWQKTQNFILQLGTTAIGVLRISWEKNSLLIRDLQIASGFRCKGAGTFLLNGAHRMAKGERFQFCQLAVFVGNPAIRFYVRHGYRYMEQLLAPNAAEWHMIRRV